MSAGSLTRRYVQPLFEVAEERGVVAQVDKDLERLDEALKVSSELKRFLADPAVERPLKRAALEKLFADASPITVNFLRVVVDKNRTDLLPSAREAFRGFWNAKRGVTKGTIVTVADISDQQFTAIQSKLERRFGCRLELTRKVDPAIVGGMVARIGNTLLDGSVRTRLAGLRKALAGA